MQVAQANQVQGQRAIEAKAARERALRAEAQAKAAAREKERERKARNALGRAARHATPHTTRAPKSHSPTPRQRPRG